MRRTGLVFAVAAVVALVGCASAAQPSRASSHRALCTGLPDADRESPFKHRDDILAVERLSSLPASAKPIHSARLRGARITMRATPGLTREYLDRIVTCQVGRDDVGSPDRASPLALAGANATVDSAGGTFVIDVTSDDHETARQIVERANALVAD